MRLAVLPSETCRRQIAGALLAMIAAAPAFASGDPDRVPTAPILSYTSLAIVSVTGLLVVGCVLLHYEVLRFLARLLLRFHAKRRRRILLLVFSLLVLAIVEIWLFGVAYFWLLSHPGYGALHGPGRVDGLLDYVYFSAVIYSTLGLGDLVPSGSIRFLVGTQALVGFTLISWSAAFTFLEMERFWRDSTAQRHRAAYGAERGRDGR